MPASNLVDPPQPEPAPGGIGATSSVAGSRPAAETGAGSSADPAAEKAKEALDHGWTGLGLPAYSEPRAGPEHASPGEPRAPLPSASDPIAAIFDEPDVPSVRGSALPPERVSAPPPERASVLPAEAPARRETSGVKAAASAVRAQTPPRPTGKSGAFAAARLPAPSTEAPPRPPAADAAPPKPATPEPAPARPVPPPRPSSPEGAPAAPPRPSGRSGAYAAARLPASAQDASSGRPSVTDGSPGRISVTDAAPARISVTEAAPARPPAPHAPAAQPAPMASAPAATASPVATLPLAQPATAPMAPAPPAAPPSPSATVGLLTTLPLIAPAPATPAPLPAAGRPAFQPAPAEEEREITVEDEGDLGATIPEQPLHFDDLTATVPILPQPVQAPSFGLPPLDPAPAQPPPIAAAPAGPAPLKPIPPPPPAPPPEHSPDADAGPPPYGPGAIIGEKYRLIRIIGRGGMGAVWVAHNTALDVEVAIKLMRRDRATPEAAARFTNEARAAARLGHPSIVRVFDFGETSRGDPFIVMELLHGESFGALLARKKKLSPTVAVQTLLPVGHALAAAHAKGIVHRDLKPDNILLAKDESGVVTPKVVDFGIAKLVTADVERHFTIAGEVLGSPDYMSPEQARGEEDIDHRSDIWTFTVLLYEAITGKRPFDGSNYNALLAAIIASRPVPITELGVNDPALWTILEKGLAKERDARWQAVREYGMELARWAIDRGVEHDLVGTSLSAQWLEPTRKRLFTVAGGSGPPPPAGSTETGAGPPPAIPKPPPLGALAAEVPKPAAPAIATTMPPFVPRRRPWLTAAILLVLVGGLGFALFEGGFFRWPGAPAAPSPSSTVSALPTSTASDAPSQTSSAAPSAAPTATASAKPATSAKPRPTGAAPTARPKGPAVKGDIKF
jgi:serine/threonine-protein kinase